MSKTLIKVVAGSAAAVALMFVSVAETQAQWGSFGGGSFGSHGGSFGSFGGGSFGGASFGSRGHFHGSRGGSFGGWGHGSFGSRGHGSWGHGSFGRGHGSWGHGSWGHGSFGRGHGSWGHGSWGHGSYGHGHGHGHYYSSAAPVRNHVATTTAVYPTQQRVTAPKAQEPVTAVVLKVPADAIVELSGQQMSATGTVRRFATRQLRAGQQWSDYQIKVTYNQNGQAITRNKSINLRAGEVKTIDFHGEQVLVASN